MAKTVSKIRVNSEFPFFSIIIPTYNRPQLLSRCLAGLLTLDYPRDYFEVIVVDDGSKTPLNVIIERFTKKLNLKLIYQKNTGSAAARNAAAEIAAGDYLAFTNDDCTPSADWLTIFAEYFSETPNCMLGGKMVNALRGNPYAAASQLIVDNIYRQYVSNPDNVQFFAAANMAVPAKLFRKIGGFQRHLRTSGDREFCYRWLANGFQMSYAPEAIVHHAHKLNLLNFCGQHFQIGRGSYYYFKSRASRGSGNHSTGITSRKNSQSWLRYLFMEVNHTHKVHLLFLLSIRQAANAAGFITEALKRVFKPRRASKKIV